MTMRRQRQKRRPRGGPPSQCHPAAAAHAHLLCASEPPHVELVSSATRHGCYTALRP